MITRFCILLIFFLLQFTISAQTTVDTVHCMGITGYGPMTNGKREGNWAYRYDYNKALYARGAYRQGKKSGEWIFYRGIYKNEPAKDILYTIHYQNNQPDGEMFCYDFTGKISRYGQFINGKAEGQWTTFEEDGKTICGIENYTNGKPAGEWILKTPYSKISLKGMMDSLGPKGYWTQMLNGKVVGGGNYEKGLRTGKWKLFLDEYTFEEGLYANGLREGRWIKYTNTGMKTESYGYLKNELHGADSIWYNEKLWYIYTYKSGRIEGHYEEHAINGDLFCTGELQYNPEYEKLRKYKESLRLVNVPEIMKVDLIENNICIQELIAFTRSFHANNPEERDALVEAARSAKPVIDTSLQILNNLPPEFRTGRWYYYHHNGKLQSEGVFLPMARDSTGWDSTNYVEDPNKPGTFILAAIKFQYWIYFKTGWWKIYNDNGELIREERYELGRLVETKKVK